MNIVDALEAVVAERRWQDLGPLLASLDDDGLARARAWYRRTGRAQARRAVEWANPRGRACQLILAATMGATPAEASRLCEWGKAFAWSDADGALPAVVPVLASRGADWCHEFVAEAMQARLRSDSVRAAAELACLTLPLISHFDLAVPADGAYARGWAQLVAASHARAAAPALGRWRPLRPIRLTADGAEYAPELGSAPTLRALLDATPKLHETLLAVLATPSAMADLAGLNQPGFSLEDEVRRDVAHGTLRRDELVAAALESFTRDDTPGSQRATARLLLGLDVGPTDARLHLALIQHVLPTVHGSVTAALLPALLAADLAGEDLHDVGATILTRREKAQKTVLLRHLTAPPPGGARSGPDGATSHDGPSAVETLLELAATSDDLAFAAKASRALAARAAAAGQSAQAAPLNAGPPPPDMPAAGLLPPDLPPTPVGRSTTTGPFRAVDPSPAGLAECLSDSQTWQRITTEARWLDAVIRYGARDLPGLRRAVRSMPDAERWSSSRTYFLLKQWAQTGDTRRSYLLTSTSYRFENGRTDPVVTSTTREHPPEAYDALTDALITETLERLGTTGELLSTPSRADGTLSLADLARRIRATRSDGYAPYDLLQALLRLEPTPVKALSVLDGLHLAPAARASSTNAVARWLRRGHAPDGDGVGIIRAWIKAGGLPARKAELVDGRPTCPAVTLPRVLPQVDVLAPLATRIAPGSGHRLGWEGGAYPRLLGTVPSWAETLITLVELGGNRDGVEQLDRLPVLVHSAGPFGPAVHHHLARLLAHPRQDCRLAAAENVLTVMAQGRLDPTLLRDAAVALFDAGELPLARPAAAWEQVILGGGLAPLWPTVRGVMAQACSRPRKPAGLADLLRAVRPYAALAPGAEDGAALPAALHALASSPGSTKAQVEARALVAAAASARAATPAGRALAPAMGYS